MAITNCDVILDTVKQTIGAPGRKQCTDGDNIADCANRCSDSSDESFVNIKVRYGQHMVNRYAVKKGTECINRVLKE